MPRLSFPSPWVLILFVASSVPALAHASPAGLPYVGSITTLPSVPCQGVPTQLVISGSFPSACGRVLGHDLSRLLVAVSDPAPTCRGCAAVVVDWADTLDLGQLAAGSHHVVITLGVVDACPAVPETTFYKTGFDFTVQMMCVPDPLRYLQQVKIVPARDTSSTAICPGDSIRVLFSGRFPDDCHLLRKVELLPSPIAGPWPEPPIVRLVFDNLCCADVVCRMMPIPWSAAVTLPPLPSRAYNLIVEGVEVCCRDTVLPEDPRSTRLVPFGVLPRESCPVTPPVACLLPSWDHSNRVGDCDVGFDRDGKAPLSFGVHTTVALAGLQGAVHVTTDTGDPGLLFVSQIEPVGVAAGMHLTWQPIPSGASFVLFSEQGAPIPATPPDQPPAPVLRFTFEHVPTMSGADIMPDPTRKWVVHALDLLGSDSTGGAVPHCPVRITGRLDDVATICAGGLCDLNGDAIADVRDLVLMVRCLKGTGPCPLDPVTTLDCEGDNDFDLADVICCARAVLGGPGCRGCPADTVRKEPRVAVTFGDPVHTGSAVEIPVHLSGVDRLGAARLTFVLPAGVADASIRLQVDDPAWLVLDQRSGSRLMLGLISLGPPGPTFAPPAGELDFTLHLALETGGKPAGSVAVGDAEFSGGDGVLLAVDFGSPSVRLGPGLAVVLSPAKPNPFRASTSFRLSLDASADVDLGVYDLAGRRVASLHQGRLAVGVHAFSWGGRDDHGSQVPAGVYFVRASATGASAVQKLVMVRGD